MAKYAHDSIVPFKESDQSKKQQVATMFDKIAFRYDFLNRFLSAGIDVSWRKTAIKELRSIKPTHVLDVATGTGDVAILTQKTLLPTKITGVDISAGMLEIGRQKIAKLRLQNQIELLQGDSEMLPFADNSFDAVTVAFGVRNFQNLEKGLAEMLRVLRPGGKLVVLEFSRPKQILFKTMYNTYMNNIAPAFAELFSKNKGAYQYLNKSMQKFPEGQFFLNILSGVGYKYTYSKKLTLGICSVYCGSK